jgi:hypothetical protein
VGLWGYFSPKPRVRNSRWFCWFGTELGSSEKAVTPSVEINLTLDPTRRAAGGRSLVGDDGQFYLGHKGLLGGGRGGQLSMTDFAAGIRGFVREPILLDKQREEWVFVLGSPGARDFLERLWSFVLECVNVCVCLHVPEGPRGNPLAEAEGKDPLDSLRNTT